MKCRFQGHEAASATVRNQGLEFGRCRHCRRDLVRTGRRWRDVPTGFRVVWRREPGPVAQSAAQLELDLVSPQRALVPWRADVARLRLAAQAAKAFARWASPARIFAKAPAARAALMLRRARARAYATLWPVESERSCIRLPYRPLPARA